MSDINISVHSKALEQVWKAKRLLLCKGFLSDLQVFESDQAFRNKEKIEEFNQNQNV